MTMIDTASDAPRFAFGKNWESFVECAGLAERLIEAQAKSFATLAGYRTATTVGPTTGLDHWTTITRCQRLSCQAEVTSL